MAQSPLIGHQGRLRTYHWSLATNKVNVASFLVMSCCKQHPGHQPSSTLAFLAMLGTKHIMLRGHEAGGNTLTKLIKLIKIMFLLSGHLCRALQSLTKSVQCNNCSFIVLARVIVVITGAWPSRTRVACVAVESIFIQSGY